MFLLPCKVAILPGSGNEDVDILGDERASFFLPLDMNGRPCFQCVLSSASVVHICHRSNPPKQTSLCLRLVQRGARAPESAQSVRTEDWSGWERKGGGDINLTSLFLNPTPLRLLLFLHCPQSTCNISFRFADGKNTSERTQRA